jgi:sensor domain CHASE-containing protein
MQISNLNILFFLKFLLLAIFSKKNMTISTKSKKLSKKKLRKETANHRKIKKSLQHSDANTNLFRAIREIKEEWSNAGQVAKSEFKNLNNNYFYHLNQFLSNVRLK